MLESGFSSQGLCDAARHMGVQVCRPGRSGLGGRHTPVGVVEPAVCSCLTAPQSCGRTCVSAGAALQADVPEGGALLLVEERQADRGHHHRGAHHRPHHHPAGHRCDPRQRPAAPHRQPHPQRAINTLTRAHSVHTPWLSDEVSLPLLEFSGRKASF